MLITVEKTPPYVEWGKARHIDQDACQAIVGIPLFVITDLDNRHYIVTRKEIEQALERAKRMKALERLRVRWNQVNLTLGQGIFIPIESASTSPAPKAIPGQVRIASRPGWIRKGRLESTFQDQSVLKALTGKVLQLKRAPEQVGQAWLVTVVSIEAVLETESVAFHSWQAYRCRNGIKQRDCVLLPANCAELIPDEPTEKEA